MIASRPPDDCKRLVRHEVTWVKYLGLEGTSAGWASTESPSPYCRGVAGNGWVSSRP